MSYDLIIAGQEYNGVDTIKIPSASGGNVTFVPSGQLKAFLEGSLIEINDDSIISLYNYAFYGSPIESVRLENLTTMNGQAFMNCAKLKTAIFPNCVSCAKNANFKYCSSLTSFEAPNLERFGQSTFCACTSLEEINLPKLKTLDLETFTGCINLKKVDLAVCTTLYNNTFYNCKLLEAIILRSPTMATLNGSLGNGINDTFKIYVPSALIESYKVATNWSTYADKFVAIEGSEYE